MSIEAFVRILERLGELGSVWESGEHLKDAWSTWNSFGVMEHLREFGSVCESFGPFLRVFGVWEFRESFGAYKNAMIL